MIRPALSTRTKFPRSNVPSGANRTSELATAAFRPLGTTCIHSMATPHDHKYVFFAAIVKPRRNQESSLQMLSEELIHLEHRYFALPKYGGKLVVG